VKQAEFTALIDGFTNGHLNSSSFNAGLVRLLDQNPDITPADLLTSTQSLLHNGAINPKDFRLISQIIAELNIQRALDTRKNATIHKNDSDLTGGQSETLIMQHPPDAGTDDETLIMPNHPDAISSSGAKLRSKPPKMTGSVKVGSVLKGRFELLELIGRGGMGVVFKARDLVKVQAQDNNPYVAIKVLSEAFKKHSRAFIALQREASKAQRLAHPNITTVFDFDHDGETIYMTMELLHGQPFDKLIAQLPEGGLPKPIAFRYIAELCHGLAYTHKQQLIHCDLKPANIILSDNGTVKLLDFGITRAVKKEQRESGDETQFDPASLKALTPAYASMEMFRGDTPDPRDDIYALACVAYELLTGAHPYKKVAAHKALELKLKPPPVKGLSRHQQRALNNALALVRDKRTPTIEKFMEGFQPPKSHVKQLIIISSALLLMTGMLGVKSIQEQRREDVQLDLIQSIQNGDQARLTALINTIHQLDEQNFAYLTRVLRKEIITYYQDRINAAINAREKHYDFPEASRLLEQVKMLYPDSAALGEAERQLETNRTNLIEKLLESYEELQAGGKDTARVLEILAEAAPNHPLLKTTGNR
jgi:serine/threonine protein kinase